VEWEGARVPCGMAAEAALHPKAFGIGDGGGIKQEQQIPNYRVRGGPRGRFHAPAFHATTPARTKEF